MALPGAPAVYYGDEIGLEGGEDPDCRQAFPWEKDKWDQDLHSFVRKLISLRKKYSLLRRGSYQEILVEGERGGYAFARRLGEENLLVLLNASETGRGFQVPISQLGWSEGRIVRDLLQGQEFIVSGTELILDAQPWSGMWIY
jgi:glycosidase